MPEIGRIQSTNFQSLLTELGITRNNIPFALRSEVTPVVLVGGTVSFLAAPTPAYGVNDIFTAGEQVAPAAGTVLADTGQLPVGAYTVLAVMTANETQSWDFEWRNAANSANLAAIRFKMVIATTITQIFTSRFNILNDNERFRVINAGAGGVGIAYNASILAKI